MNKIVQLLTAGLLCMIASCSNSTKDNLKDEEVSESKSQGNSLGVEYAVKDLLARSISSDTIQHYSTEPFLFFKTGNLFDLNFRTSLVLTSPTDSTFKLKVYKLSDSVWQLTDSLDGLNANKAQFFIESKDYNFDKQADIFIQYAYTNGYPRSLGSVILVDPATKKLTLHKGASNLSNISLEPNSGILRAEELYERNVAGKDEKIWVKRYSWKGYQMQVIDSSLELISEKE